MHKYYLMLVVIFLQSCAFFPVESRDQDLAEECELTTRSLDLSVRNYLSGVGTMGCNNEACLLIPFVIVPVGSFIVSGSIVLTGNTLHWLEYQSKCNLGLEFFPSGETIKPISTAPPGPTAPLVKECVLRCELSTGKCECME